MTAFIRVVFFGFVCLFVWVLFLFLNQKTITNLFAPIYNDELLKRSYLLMDVTTQFS